MAVERTEPGLLVSLNLDGQAKVSQLDCSILTLAGQEQILRLPLDTNRRIESATVDVRAQVCRRLFL